MHFNVYSRNEYKLYTLRLTVKKEKKMISSSKVIKEYFIFVKKIQNTL